VQLGQWYYSYTANLLLSGARTEMLAGAHYPLPLVPLPGNPQYNRTDHRQQMAPFAGVPLVIEEDINYYLTNVDDSGWCNDDSISARHLPLPNRMGWGNLGFIDGHVNRIQFQERIASMGSGYYFSANNMCVRTTGRKWVSGRSWNFKGNMYGFMDAAPPASTHGLVH
jgi:prepilin-type processing-associated H-X9-DG protein